MPGSNVSLAGRHNSLHTGPMKNIMMTWELGAGLGHIAGRIEYRSLLEQRGHRVALAVRDLRALFGLRPNTGAPVFAAPNPPATSLAPQRTMLSFADVLWHDTGLYDPAICVGILAAWRSLLAETRCDLLVADAAPMAMVAAKSMGIPVLRHGISFLHPPAVTPFPVFRSWEQHDASYLPELEAKGLEHINQALAKFGANPMSSLSAACADAPLILDSIAELDVYGPRETLACLPAQLIGVGTPACWPETGQARIFCYLKQGYPWLDRLIGALARAPAQTSLFIDGGRPALPAGAPIFLHDGPVDTRDALARSHLVICAAGSGMINQCLLAGKPMLLLPTQAEQYLNAQKTVGLGAALSVTPPLDKPEFLTPIRRLLGEPEFTQAAELIAARYTDMRMIDQHERIAALIESQFE